LDVNIKKAPHLRTSGVAKVYKLKIFRAMKICLFQDNKKSPHKAG
jgi:hypothetical protein